MRLDLKEFAKLFSSNRIARHPRGMQRAAHQLREKSERICKQSEHAVDSAHGASKERTRSCSDRKVARDAILGASDSIPGLPRHTGARQTCHAQRIKRKASCNLS